MTWLILSEVSHSPYRITLAALQLLINQFKYGMCKYSHTQKLSCLWLEKNDKIIGASLLLYSFLK